MIATGSQRITIERINNCNLGRGVIIPKLKLVDERRKEKEKRYPTWSP